MPDRTKTTDVVVVVKGRPNRSWCCEKEKVAGIWVNADRTRYRSAPSFYAIASARPVADIVDERTRAIYELGLSSLQLSPASGAVAASRRGSTPGWSTCAAAAGCIRGCQGVEITDGVLYRAHVSIPARVPVGRFTAETFLIQGRPRAGSGGARHRHPQSGFERFVARAADRSSFLYDWRRSPCRSRSAGAPGGDRAALLTPAHSGEASGLADTANAFLRVRAQGLASNRGTRMAESLDRRGFETAEPIGLGGGKAAEAAPAPAPAPAEIGGVFEISGSSSSVLLDLDALDAIANDSDPAVAASGQVGSQIKMRVGNTWLVANVAR